MTFHDQFIKWMHLLSKSGNPSQEIVAFNFGIFEAEEGFTVYLTGAKNFDRDKSSILKDAKYITTGFDDGDLEVVIEY